MTRPFPSRDIGLLTLSMTQDEARELLMAAANQPPADADARVLRAELRGRLGALIEEGWVAPRG